MKLEIVPSMGPVGPFQTRPIFGPYYNLWGCGVSSVICLTGYEGGLFFTDQESKMIYLNGMDDGCIQKELSGPDGKTPADGCDVYSWEKLWRLAGGKLNEKMPAPVFKAAAQRAPKDNERCVMRCARKGHPGFHFMASNNNVNPDHWQDEILHDSIELRTLEDGTKMPGSWTQYDGWIVSRIIFTLPD